MEIESINIVLKITLEKIVYNILHVAVFLKDIQ